MTSSKDFFVNLEWVWRFSKLSKLTPNSYVFIFLLFAFFGQEEWVWSEFGDSPNWLQIRSKLICFHFFCFIFFWEKGNEFGVSLGILQTHPKLKWFLFFSLCVSLYCYLKHFLGREEWVWSKFGGSSNSLQTYSKLAPNSYGFILLFLLYCQLIVFILSVIFTGSFLRKRNEFGGSPKSLQSRWGHL